ncbi:NAD(P)H-binding protein [Nonomuraea sp. NPDC002799]
MIVVTGASGNVGSSLVRVLAEAGERVTGVSRSPWDGAPAGVRHRQADLGDVRSLEPVLEGAAALFLLVAGDDPQGVLGAAKAAGVRKVVLVSSVGAGTRPEMYAHPRLFEEAVRGSELEWTILRSGGLDSNAFRWAGSIRAEGSAAAPFADVALPTVDPADVADVAAAVLVGEGHGGRTYELTGPAPVSPREQVGAIAGALGTPVRFVEQSRAEARAQMMTFMPEPVVDATLGVLGEPSPGELRVSPDVEEVLGRAPRTFAEWAARNAPAFR